MAMADSNAQFPERINRPASPAPWEKKESDEGGPRRQIAHTVFDSFSPQLDLSFAAAIYGLVGLFLGSLVGELATAVFLPRRHLAG